jgi:AraC-like DNA-binding protein
MKTLAIRRLPPSPVLNECIKDIWVFESREKLGEEELRIIAPNGSVKLLLYYEGHLKGQVGGRVFRVPEHRLYVAGVTDCPAIADFHRDEPFGCISIELNPVAAYRLLPVPQHELRNAIVPFVELFGTSAVRNLEEQIHLASNPAHKAALLQEYLTGVFFRTERDATFEYGAGAILNAHGPIRLAALSRDMGHSERWLRARFTERLGVSPKTFASIVRFQSCFRALLRDKRGFLQGGHYYNRYYDQAHFIKEFKRFMGHSPSRYTALQNEVGEIIYKV